MASKRVKPVFHPWVPTQRPSPTSPTEASKLPVPEAPAMAFASSAVMSSAPVSPSMLPVPTEMPSSPTATPREATQEVPTATVTRTGPTVTSGPTLEVPPLEPPYGSVAMGSSGLMSSAIPSPSEMPVPTEMPTSPLAPQDPTEAVTGDTGTLGTNVPTISGGERTQELQGIHR
eukprot:s1210_g4.t1